MLRSSYRAVVAGLVLLPLLASAAPSPPGDRDLIRDRQQRLLDEQRKRLEELQQLPGKERPPLRMPPAATSAASRSAASSWKAPGTSAKARVANCWRPTRGAAWASASSMRCSRPSPTITWIAATSPPRAYLPQQDLASGTLRIIVVEGRLEGLDSSALASPRELTMSFPGRTGELLDLRELEQLVDQLSRLPSRQAQLELVPGSEVGGSRVRLKGERDKPWRVSATRNNDGDVSTGEQQMGLGLDWDSPLGLADQLNLRANRDAVTDRWRHSDSQSLFYSLPWGWWTFTYGYSQSDYRTRNEASGFPFKLDGDSRSHQFRAERVLHRDGVSKTAMSLGLQPPAHQQLCRRHPPGRPEHADHRDPARLPTMAGGSAAVSSTSTLAGSRASAPLARRVAATRTRAIRMRVTTSTA